MDKQKQIEEMAKDICGKYNNGGCEIDGYVCNLRCDSRIRAEICYEQGYRKIPENAVVLTGTEERLEDLLVDFDEMSFYPLTYCANAEAYTEDWKRKLIYVIGRLRKETVEKFAEMARQRLDEYRLESEYFTDNEPNGNLWQINSSIFYLEVIDKGGLIDEIAKEITEGKVCANMND